ncbi:MAG TPA: hypothetical protein VGU64_09815 [Terriglobales bacterium]|nr:hypothetical protein [Terriglobales bacterium]
MNWHFQHFRIESRPAGTPGRRPRQLRSLVDCSQSREEHPPYNTNGVKPEEAEAEGILKKRKLLQPANTTM